MSDLKAGWTRVKFGDVVRLANDKCVDPIAQGIDRYIGLEHLEPGDLRVRKWGDVADGITFTTRVRPGQVLFGKRRAYQRKIAVANFDAVCSGDIYVFEAANTSQLLPELLPFVCQTEEFFEYAIGTSAGSLSPRTNWTSLADYEFALPPLREQSRIARLLKALCVEQEALGAVHESAEKLVSAMTASKFATLDDLAQVPLGEIAEVQYGLTVNPSRRDSQIQARYLRVANVQRDSIALDEVKQIGWLKGDERFVLRQDDILVVEGHADADEVGRAALWNDCDDVYLHQNHLIRVRVRSDVALPAYVLMYLNSSPGRAYFRQHAKSTSGLNTLNSTVVRNMPIPVPPIRSQCRIIEVASTICTAAYRAKQHLQRARTIFGNQLTCLGKPT